MAWYRVIAMTKEYSTKYTLNFPFQVDTEFKYREKWIKEAETQISKRISYHKNRWVGKKGIILFPIEDTCKGGQWAPVEFQKGLSKIEKHSCNIEWERVTSLKIKLVTTLSLDALEYEAKVNNENNYLRGRF